MIISEKWLKKYIPDFAVGEVKKFRHQVDTRLSEVEDVIQKGEGISQIFTALVKEVAPHPQSDKLHLCKVDAGNGELLQIVCGAPNVSPNMISILCKIGGKVYDHSTGLPTELVEKEIKGVKSQGMLCSPAELGIYDYHEGIIALPSETPIGEEVTHYLQDTLIVLENKAFPHRPDAFSHQGIAREFAAIFKSKYQTPPVPETKFMQESELPFEVEVKVPASICPRFSAVSVDNIRLQPSPFWLQVQLGYCGVRPINNVVDITNYVMLDIGQPMHAFDYQNIPGQKLVVRYSKPAEKITTLDNKQRNLPPDTVVVADSSSPQSIAGIMGGKQAEIGTNTSGIILEAATWEMYNIRRSSRALGLRSDASTRYEKGVTAARTTVALTQAVSMIIDIAGGNVATDLIDIYPEPETQNIIEFEVRSISRLLGIKIPKNDLLDIFDSLGIEVIDREQIPADDSTNLVINLRIPPQRRDLRIAADILEEIARFHGYENFEHTLPKRDLTPATVNQELAIMQSIKESLAAAGLWEVITYSMVGEQLYLKALLSTRGLFAIQMPISPELAFVRDTLVPSLLEKVQQNAAKYAEFGLFEVSRVANKQIDQVTQLPVQPHKLAFCYVHDAPEIAYRRLKLGFEALTARWQITMKQDHELQLPPFMHPGQSAVLEINGQHVGYIGNLHPQVCANFQQKGRAVAVCEIDFETLRDTQSEAASLPFQSISKFPAVVRDLSFWGPKSQERPIISLLDELRRQEPDLLDSLEVVDIYDLENQRSYTLRAVLQPRESTLTQEQISSVIDKLITTAEKVGYSLRS